MGEASRGDVAAIFLGDTNMGGCAVEFPGGLPVTRCTENGVIEDDVVRRAMFEPSRREFVAATALIGAGVGAGLPKMAATESAAAARAVEMPGVAFGKWGRCGR